MNKLILIVLLIVAAGVIVYAGGKRGSSSKPEPGSSKSAVYRKISPAEAHKMMSESKDYVLLDVRTKEEHSEKHISGAVLIPVDVLEARAEKELPDKKAVILVYCRSGRRSASAAHTLLKLGYENVYDFGGINSWPYETVSK